MDIVWGIGNLKGGLGLYIEQMLISSCLQSKLNIYFFSCPYINLACYFL